MAKNGHFVRALPAPRRHCFVTCYPLETPELPATFQGMTGDDAMNTVGVSKNRGTLKWMAYNGKPY